MQKKPAKLNTVAYLLNEEDSFLCTALTAALLKPSTPSEKGCRKGCYLSFTGTADVSVHLQTNKQNFTMS